MKNIRNSKILKIIVYTLVPILVLNIGINVVSLIYYSENEEDFVDYKNYISTNSFSNDYLSNIQKAIDIAENEKERLFENNKEHMEITNGNNNIILKETNEEEKELIHENIIVEEKELVHENIIVEEKELIYDNITIEEKELIHDNIIIGEKLENNVTTNQIENKEKDIQMNFYSIKNYYILLISKDGDVLTNVEKNVNTDTLEEIKEYISKNKFYWQYDKQNIKTNIDKLQYEQIAYNGFEFLQESGYEIYTAIKDEDGGYWYRQSLFYDFVANTYETAFINIVISSILLIAGIFYIILSIGHKQGIQGIYIDSLDKIPYEIIGILAGILSVIGFIAIILSAKLTYNNFSKLAIDSGISVTVLLGFILYTILATLGVTTIRRIKAHIFWKNTISYKILKFIFDGIFTNISQTVKVVFLYGGFIIISFALIMFAIKMPIMIFVLLIFWYYIFKKILNYINGLNKIRQKISKMYNGQINEILQEDEVCGKLKIIAKELNDISGGLLNAVEEATKSERLKTELITNVSHDIKTPLTSIINYVDLMKKESIENEKVREYLNVLDSKSQRLKKLTEDLIEASKASSGNIKLTMEMLNVKELIKQVSGEFEDRFNKKGLQIIESYPQEEVTITADSRYLYRVMENVYSNISKYALENSRVYVDVIKTKENVQIILKNISGEKLNISVDELMQRFVRGDESRSTGGSGLGISIAKSLVELQKGKFNIYLDGDLFKVVIEF